MVFVGGDPKTVGQSRAQRTTRTGQIASIFVRQKWVNIEPHQQGAIKTSFTLLYASYDVALHETGIHPEEYGYLCTILMCEFFERLVLP